MQGSHTPGPWTLERVEHHDSPSWNIDAGSFGPIAQVDSDNGADASLVAAAPDLLEAALYAVSVIDGDLEASYAAEDRLRAAIAKATKDV